MQGKPLLSAHRTAAVFFVLTSCLGAGCKKEPNRATEPTTPDVERSLRIAMVEPATLDPSLLADGPGRKIAGNLFVGLTERDESGQVIPACATSWSASDDGLTWRFKIKPDLVWSDGTPLNASTFVSSWLRSTAPETRNPMVEMFDVIRGATERRKGDASTTFGVSAPAADTLVVQVVRPTPDLPKRLAGAWAAPVPTHAIDTHGSRWTRPEHIVVNGPYRLTAHRAGQSMSFVRNDKAPTPGHIPAVHIRFSGDPVDGKRWFDLDEIDWADNLVPKDAIAALRRVKHSPLRTSPFLGLTFVVPNARKATLNTAVRQALSHAVDRSKLVRHVLDGSQRALVRPLPRELLATPPATGFSASDATARWTTAKQRPASLELAFYNGGRNPDIATFLQRGWKETLGLDVTLRGMEWKSFLEATGRGEFDLALFTLGGYDAADLLSMFVSDSPNNRGGYQSAEVDGALRKAGLATTPEARRDLLARAESVLVKDMAVITLLQLSRTSLVRNDLSGWAPNLDDHHPWRFMRW